MFDNLFEDVGGKIKRLTKFFACLGMILSIVIAIGCMVEGFVGVGLLIGVIGFLFSWISSWLMYGFGEIVQSLISIDQKLKYTVQPNNTRQLNNTVQSQKENLAKQGEVFSAWGNTETSNKDKETLYQFALEQIEKKQYKFARDTLKRISGYKDSDELLEKINLLL